MKVNTSKTKVMVFVVGKLDRVAIMIIEFLIFVLTTIVVYIWYSHRKAVNAFTSRGVRVLPGVPLFGNFFKSAFLRRHFLDDLNECYNAFPGERYVGILEGTGSVIVIRDPDLIKQITVKDFDSFINHRDFSNDADPLFDNSLLMMKGDKWRHMRAALSPAFTGSKMKQMVPFMNAISQNIVNYVQKLTEGKADNTTEELDIDDLMRRYTNDVIASAAFGLEVNSLEEKANEFYVTGQRITNFSTWQRINLFLMSVFPSISKRLNLKIFPEQTTEFIRNIVKNTMEFRKQNNIERPDMIQLLMEAAKGTLNSNTKENDNVGFATTEETQLNVDTSTKQWTDDELTAQAFIFFFAGFETSASTLVFAVHELALYPDVQNKLYEEVEQFKNDDKCLNYERIQELKYLDMVINETFRKWSPAIVLDRVCLRPYELPPPRPGADPYIVDKGTVVYNVVNSIHMDATYYPDPQRFDPERFSEENKRNIQSFTFMPFGVGPRNCIGSRFALLELKVLLYHLVLNFEILKCDKTTDPLVLKPTDFQIKALGVAIMIIEFLIFVLTTIVVYTWYSHRKAVNAFTSRGLRVLPGVPLFGNFLKSTFLRRHFLDDLHDCYNAFPNERYIGLLEGTTSIILIRDPELIKQITVKDFDNFVDHRNFFHDADPLFASSLLMMKGDKWRHMRATMSPAFTGSKMKQMVPFMNAISQNIVNYVQKLTEGKEDNTTEELDIDNLMRRYTNDVIASAAFGLEVNSLEEKANEFYVTGQRLSNFSTWQRINMFIISAFPYVSKRLNLKIFPEQTTEFFRNIVKNTIEYRKVNNIERPDMIQLLMEATKGTLKCDTKENDSVGFATTEETQLNVDTSTKQWTDDELTAQAFIFFFAGFESSASALVMAIHELAINPDVQNKLYKEVQEFKNEIKCLTYESVQELKYLDMVINETFRKWSPAIILDRVCLRPYELPPPRPGAKPYTVDKGAVVYNVVNSIHMDETYYPDPQRFDPERFSEENKRNVKSFTFMPFGVGPRNCIGSRFALLELKVLLYHIVLNFEILKCDKTTDPLVLKPTDFQIKALGGTWVKLRRRT
ncbi:Probable cytochrome P450 9f2 [Eumeta japonica]|uniref:unspecific monooxygenase n=1 Tax=Eumeta variegata TaxID=151549 RepID=A0A4C1YN21_EUMVA|nr:Probable cytochrome P450 9f2 [Eumeta japonica]